MGMANDDTETANHSETLGHRAGTYTFPQRHKEEPDKDYKKRQERHAERPALLELERFERRALERKAAELEEELKVHSDLKADNQRLKDENAALIRVISKLSK
ncbi:protein phosphatase 1 regulatory subunit 12C-like isoform X2 [Hyperolius riggenbachi]|uniref:protein phosphatase 1 regulatory subunit 12C-like isoform X2 n=1 Tax=Hyperolius riggenbachi TaxID=752182 RepID=UPI0035A33BBD